MIDKLRSNFNKFKSYLIGSKLGIEGATNGNSVIMGAKGSINAKARQDRLTWVFLGVGLVLSLIWMKYKSTAEDKNAPVQETGNVKVEVASAALDSEKMWRNYFEDKLIDTTTKSNEKLSLIENSINDQSVAYQKQLQSEMEKLKAQMQYLHEEQASSKRDLSDIKLKSSQEEDKQDFKSQPRLIESRITVNSMDRGESFDRPKSARSFIPETAYVTGKLLGGIAVSTSMGSSSEPVPVIIRITDRGNLPKNFNIDLTHCQIMGSSYGDLSSERAVVRAEVLSCQDPVNELIYTTKIAGVIYGDDGMNGIKGKVIQTSGKHLKNAMIGGMISGFVQSAKGQDQFSLSSLGAINTTKKGVGEMAKEGSLNGTSNVAEKIADYYIKQAESMSPVLLVSGGTKVDIVFTKGVYLGALDVQEKLERARSEKVKK
jgi:conjugal transfer pilus assembly protein TraB